MTQTKDASSFSSDQDFDYEGWDLENVSEADNYYNLVIDKFKPFIGKNILELGAGAGSFTSHLAARFPDSSITALEPSDTMFNVLKKNTADLKNVTVEKKFLDTSLSGFGEFDCALYTNVLEHVEDDVQEMKNCYQSLKKGGYILTYSPAAMSLYSNFDKSIGHYRRYSLEEKEHKMREAGFKIVKGYYHDWIGAMIMLTKHKLLRADSAPSPQATTFYFNTLLPIFDVIDPAKVIPWGKNIFVIGVKE